MKVFELMKPRYYPHITVAFAALLTAAPLALLFLISAEPGSVESSQSDLRMAEIDRQVVPETSPPNLLSGAASEIDESDRLGLQVPHRNTGGGASSGFAYSLSSGNQQSTGQASADLPKAKVVADENNALLNDGDMLSAYGESGNTEQGRRGTQLALAGDRATEIVSDSKSIAFFGGRAVDVSISDLSDADLMADLSLPAAATDPGSQMEDGLHNESALRGMQPSGDVVSQGVPGDHVSPAIEVIPGAMARGGDDLLESASSDPGSYYDATGHLALMNQVPVGSSRPADTTATQRRSSGDKSLAPAGTVTSEENSPAEKAVSKRRSRSKSSSGPNSENNDSSDMVETPQVNDLVEDVILQTPFENRPVGRIENVLAITRAKGWPVALVRSDLPGDDWWVQQMVGIQGNAFTARVNFGNEDSIAGSAYRLVFVFLDSPDEVRRFRIAKQFKELPEGVRRSREYLFIRQ